MNKDLSQEMGSSVLRTELEKAAPKSEAGDLQVRIQAPDGTRFGVVEILKEEDGTLVFVMGSRAYLTG